MKNLPRVLCVALLSLSTVAVVQDPKPTAKHLAKPTVTFHGEHSAIAKKRYVKITDAQQWAKLWGEHLGKPVGRKYGYFYNPLNVPDIDFKNNMVVAIFQGARWNSAGVTLKQFLDGDELTLRFDDNSYQTTVIEVADGKVPEQAKSKPFGMFVLPKTDKTIVLEENVQNRVAKPPKWQARGKL